MAFSSLWSWWRRPPRPLDHVHIVLYTRKGCHLCDDALAVLERVRRANRFGLEVIDIDADPQLVQQYGHDVPVVTVDGKLRFRGKVNEVLLRRLLRATPLDGTA